MSVYLCSSKIKVTMNGLFTLSGDRLRCRTWWDLHVSPVLLVSCTGSIQMSPEVSQETALLACSSSSRRSPMPDKNCLLDGCRKRGASRVETLLQPEDQTTHQASGACLSSAELQEFVFWCSIIGVQSSSVQVFEYSCRRTCCMLA